MNFCAIQVVRLDRLDVRHRTRSFFIRLNPRGEIYFSLKELIDMFAKVGLQRTKILGSVEPYGMRRLVSAGRSSMFCCLAWFGRTLWDEAISLCR